MASILPTGLWSVNGGGTMPAELHASQLSVENPSEAGHTIVGDFGEIAGATLAERTDARMWKALLQKS